MAYKVGEKKLVRALLKSPLNSELIQGATKEFNNKMSKFKTEDTISHVQIEDLPEDSWMVRPCEMYNLEYKDCNSFKGHFHQYFIHGSVLDCTQWKTDYNNCMKWRKHGDAEALVSEISLSIISFKNNLSEVAFLIPRNCILKGKVIDSEKDRVSVRLGATRANDVWNLREEKLNSDDWNRPLPEWITKDHPSSYLQAMKSMHGNEMSMDKDRHFCTIL